MNTDLRKGAKNGFWKIFFKLINNGAFGKTMENIWKTTVKRRNYLIFEPNYHTIKIFTEYLLAIQMKKKQGYLWINLSIWDFQY